MNIERELRLINFLYYLKTNPNKVQRLAVEYYAKYLEHQSQLRNLKQNCHDLERNCKELEAEKEKLYADYELLRLALEARKSVAGVPPVEDIEQEEEQKRNIDSGCDLHLTLPTFLSPNPHNYLQS